VSDKPRSVTDKVLALLAAFYIGVWWRRRSLPRSRWFYRAVIAAGPLALVALIAGWVTTEVGRQPWVVYGYMRTPEAASDNPGLWWLLGISVVVYGAMTVGAAIVLRSMARRWREGEESLPSPYGPQALVAGERR
jgi:cytochrome d ubiquinol oxidase subunit I